MIIDKLSNGNIYKALGPRVAAAFDFLQKNDLEKLPDGKHIIDGEHLFALSFRYNSQPIEAGTWEAHRRYADLQYIVRGEERMGIGLQGRLEEKPYDESRDCVFMNGDYTDIITVKAGEFVIFWPGEAHKPNLAVTSPAPVAKVVLKIEFE
ncbi:MAG: YhcH/YjgK/YiaL family protein [Candidatus Hydrogenedentes bacterium]|nr:YhcH/YjgK/YiaL family protein [Candidatus Hydrogenedentota bacterium]